MYTDFGKAFENVDIDIISAKMIEIYLPSNLRILFHNYLIGRSHVVKVDLYMSYEFIPRGYLRGLHLVHYYFQLTIKM